MRSGWNLSARSFDGVSLHSRFAAAMALLGEAINGRKAVELGLAWGVVAT
jgi:enoyl-CoA hydratase/carnithine racemase